MQVCNKRYAFGCGRLKPLLTAPPKTPGLPPQEELNQVSNFKPPPGQEYSDKDVFMVSSGREPHSNLLIETIENRQETSGLVTFDLALGWVQPVSPDILKVLRAMPF